MSEIESRRKSQSTRRTPATEPDTYEQEIQGAGKLLAEYWDLCEKYWRMADPGNMPESVPFDDWLMSMRFVVETLRAGRDTMVVGPYSSSVRAFAEELFTEEFLPRPPASWPKLRSASRRKRRVA